MRRLSVLLLGLVAFAAGAADAPPLLGTVLRQLAEHHAVRAQFVQTRSNPALARAQISRGRMLFVLGHGMLWQVRTPYARTLALDGRRSALVDARGHLHSLHGGGHVGRITHMLQALLAGHPQAVERQFRIAAQGDAGAWTLTFTPRQARVAHVLDAIELSGGRFLRRIGIRLHDGSDTVIELRQPRDAGPLSALERRALGLP